MRVFVITALALSLTTAPIKAQEAEESEGCSLIEEGTRLLLEGLAEDMEPAIEDLRGLSESWGPELRGFVAQMGPAMADILSKVDDLTAYHAPEILPNGDIIIRKKTPEEMAAPEDDDIEI